MDARLVGSSECLHARVFDDISSDGSKKLTICDPLHTRPARLPLYFSSSGADAARSPWEGRIMRNAMPMRWIEQAESRQVLATALFERKPTPPRSSVAQDAVSQLSTRLRSWLAARHPMGWPVVQVRPH
jgi:hypothetical protein